MSHSKDASSSDSEGDVESSKINLTTEKGDPDYKRSFNRAELDKIVQDTNCTDAHKGILNWIEKEKLCLYSKEQNKDNKGDSLIKILLEEVGNGHEVVEQVLDAYIRPKCLDPNSNAFSIELDFSGLMLDGEDKRDSGLMSWFRKESGAGDSVLDDIVELKLKYQENFWDPYINGFRGKKKQKMIQRKENCSKSFLGKLKVKVLKN